LGDIMTSVTRAETVATTLRESILKGEYVSGERLVELSLAKRLKVSQNTIRDALRMLEQDGWVVKHARGCT
jgi:DNA-binding GntR family transcriptional regulator